MSSSLNGIPASISFDDTLSTSLLSTEYLASHFLPSSSSTFTLTLSSQNAALSTVVQFVPCSGLETDVVLGVEWMSLHLSNFALGISVPSVSHHAHLALPPYPREELSSRFTEPSSPHYGVHFDKSFEKNTASHVPLLPPFVNDPISNELSSAHNTCFLPSQFFQQT